MDRFFFANLLDGLVSSVTVTLVVLVNWETFSDTTELYVGGSLDDEMLTTEFVIIFGADSIFWLYVGGGGGNICGILLAGSKTKRNKIMYLLEIIYFSSLIQLGSYPLHFHLGKLNYSSFFFSSQKNTSKLKIMRSTKLLMAELCILALKRKEII